MAGALMRKTSFLLFWGLSLSFIICTASAGNMGTLENLKSYSWVGTFSAGPIWESGGQDETFFLTPEIEKRYVGESSSQTLAAGEFFFGLQAALPYQFLGQGGVAVATASKVKFAGEIWDDASPEFNNYAYSYKIQHAHIALKGKLLADRNFWLIPWVSGSVAVGFNQSHNFHNTPIIFEALPNSDFANYTKTTFSYTVGAGLQKALGEHWQLGAGYEFADWGKSNLGRAVEQTLNTGLSLNHVYTNGVLFNLTYIA